MILSSTYLGNQQYYAHLLAPGTRVDLYEHYLKQSFRNRCEILSAQGVIPLVVPVHNRGSVKTPTREIRIDNSKRWQHRHWQALVSAYRSAPYFDHYEGIFAPFFHKPYDFLIELNLGLQETLLGLLGHREPVLFSERYEEGIPPEQDLRNALSQKARLHRPDEAFTPPVYYQVFTERLPFAPNLSVVDLLFCEGPGSAELLRGALRKNLESPAEIPTFDKHL